MRKLKQTAFLLACATVLSGCAGAFNARRQPPPVCPQIPEPPAEIMQPRKADFLLKMRLFLFEKPNEPTPSSGS